MAQKHKLRLLPEAAEDLKNIADYIAGTLCAPQAAADFVEELAEKLETVCAFPESCPIIANEYVKDKSLRKLIVRNYIAFYKATESEVIVVRVLYGLRNFKDIL